MCTCGCSTFPLTNVCGLVPGGAVAVGNQQLCLGVRAVWLLEAPTERSLLAEHAGVLVTTVATPFFLNFLFFFFGIDNPGVTRPQRGAVAECLPLPFLFTLIQPPCRSGTIGEAVGGAEMIDYHSRLSDWPSVIAVTTRPHEEMQRGVSGGRRVPLCCRGTQQSRIFHIAKHTLCERCELVIQTEGFWTLSEQRITL